MGQGLTLCSLGWPGTHCADQDGLKVTVILLPLHPTCTLKARIPTLAYLILYNYEAQKEGNGVT